MATELVDEAIALLEKANANLEPELLDARTPRKLLGLYSRVEKLGAFGRVALARKLDDATELARLAGTSIGRARETVETARVVAGSPELAGALRCGDISFEQASEISRTEAGPAGLGRRAPRRRQERALPCVEGPLPPRATRRRAEKRPRGPPARRPQGHSHTDELGMVDIHVLLEPHVGTPIVRRAEAEASRRHRAARRERTPEPFERHLADAYAAMLRGSPIKGPARRPELVVLVSHGVAKRGWTDVGEGEVCKIPGVGPVPPRVARDIASDAFLTGVFHDGTDLRHIRRWSRHVPVEVRVALELGDSPDFDGIACVDCGNRFRNENDHVEPHAAGGPASHDNLRPRCWSCHTAKTERDRKAGKLTPPEP